MKLSTLLGWIALVVAVVIIVGWSGVLGHFSISTASNNSKSDVSTLPSRLWIEYAEDIVRQVKPTPPESARLYAYVATAYARAFEATHSSREASAATAEILNALQPEYVATTSQMLIKISGINDAKTSEKSQNVVKVLKERIAQDGASLVWDGARPKGAEYWVGESPLSPLAGSWRRWIVDQSDDLTVPPPPTWGGTEFSQALKEVKKAADERTPEQAEAINFWGGTPGTEAPSGIWQNRLYDETKMYELSDQDYAKAQMYLAQTLADAFMECWKVKYMYWTSRPSMNDKTIDLAMPNPPFPSYTSGHSTISRAAAEVLAALFPAKREVWLKDATEARNSRLWAGIHFSYDNEQGFVLGEKVGNVVVKRLHIVPLK